VGIDAKIELAPTNEPRVFPELARETVTTADGAILVGDVHANGLCTEATGAGPGNAARAIDGIAERDGSIWSRCKTDEVRSASSNSMGHQASKRVGAVAIPIPEPESTHFEIVLFEPEQPFLVFDKLCDGR
jgi:hypothetical protein